MLKAQDLGGVMAMMPAFATDNAADMRARNTVDVERLHRGLDRILRDGVNVISTTGSFGECHTLLQDEFATLAHESAAAVKGRIPLFVGVTAPNAREVVERMKIVSETKADGVLAGVPYYFPSSLPNAVRFYREIAEMFPKLNIMVYHNPALHNVTLTLEIMRELAKIPSVVAMKDSHRETQTFIQLQEFLDGHISHLAPSFNLCPMPSSARRACGRSMPGWDLGRCSLCATRSPARIGRRPRKSFWTSGQKARALRTSPGARPRRKSPCASPAMSIPDRCARPSSKFPTL